jgi:hypothetical protein
VKANKTMSGQAVPNHRRKGKKVESNINLAAHNQTLKQLRQLNDRNHQIPINTNTHVNGLNSPIKRHHLTYWIKKEYTTICCLQETHLINRNKRRLKVKGWKKRFTKLMVPQNRQEKQYLSQKSRFQTYTDQRR